MKALILITGMILAGFFFASAQDEIKIPVPCSIKMAKFGTDSLNNKKNLSLYQENFKQWKNSGYQNDAINYTIDAWRHVFLNAPLASNNMYVDGLAIVEHMIKIAKTPELKEKYIDTLMMVYDRRVEAFGCKKGNEEGFIMGRKAVDLLQYRPDEKETVLKMMSRSVELQGKETEAAVVSAYFKLIVDMVKEGKKDTTEIFAAYDKMGEITAANINVIKEQIDKNPADSAKLNKKLNIWTVCESNLNVMFEPFASCEIIIKIYSSKYETNKANADFLKRVINLLGNKGCVSDPLFLKASEDYYLLSPSPDAALSLGKAFNKEKRYAEAAKYTNEAANGLTNPEDKYKAYLVLYDIYKNAGQYANAKGAAMKALDAQPNSGMPYILIGDLYYTTAGSCGGDAVTSRAGYWAAYDKYNKAKSDPKTADLAASKAGSAYVNFPKTEDIFFYGHTKGSAYTVSCWYTETTTIRSVD